MEDFIYILLGLVWLVFAFYRQKQKKQMQKAPDKEQGGEAKSPLSFLEEMLAGNDEKAETAMRPSDEMEEVYAKTTVLVDEDQFDYNFESEYSDLGISSIEGFEDGEEDITAIGDDISQQNSEDNDTPKSETGDGSFIDLRQAVIYSEILNRPDF